jgi:sporulation protein YlmC with PRC-barrel domain
MKAATLEGWAAFWVNWACIGVAKVALRLALHLDGWCGLLDHGAPCAAAIPSSFSDRNSKSPPAALLLSHQRNIPKLLELVRQSSLPKESVMGRATAHPDHQCISSEDIHGTEVYGSDGKNIGEVDHLIIDKLSGRVAYAVMSFGGFMGLAHSHYPIPWGALTYDKSLGGFRTNITEQQLKDAPEFSDDSWQDRDWETRTHRYYGARQYWETGGRM